MAITVVCPQCAEHNRGRVVMQCKKEHQSAWAFECPQCGTVRAVTKDKAGGSYGSGERDDGRRSATGTGFGTGQGRSRPVR